MVEGNMPKDIMHLGPVDVKDVTANPAPLGLMGFGMTTVLLNMHNAGWFGLGSMILAIYGAMAQVLNEVYGRVVWPLGPVK